MYYDTISSSALARLQMTEKIGAAIFWNCGYVIGRIRRLRAAWAIIVHSRCTFGRRALADARLLGINCPTVFIG